MTEAFPALGWIKAGHMVINLFYSNICLATYIHFFEDTATTLIILLPLGLSCLFTPPMWPSSFRNGVSDIHFPVMQIPYTSTQNIKPGSVKYLQYHFFILTCNSLLLHIGCIFYRATAMILETCTSTGFLWCMKNSKKHTWNGYSLL